MEIIFSRDFIFNKGIEGTMWKKVKLDFLYPDCEIQDSAWKDTDTVHIVKVILILSPAPNYFVILDKVLMEKNDFNYYKNLYELHGWEYPSK